MQSLEASYEEGEVTPSLCDCLFKMVCTHNRGFKKAKLSTQRSSLSLLNNVPTHNDSPHASATSSTTPQKPQFCIHTKLLHLYLEECAKDPNQLRTGLKRNTHLLEKLVARERLNTIILNLNPGNTGYSIAFPTHPLSDACTDDTAETMETNRWPYEDAELLRYLDLEELPAFIVDLLEPDYSFLFYSGCIIAKVRDFRSTFPDEVAAIHHVLLRPTQQSILADVQKIAEEWSPEKRAQLESRILLAHHPTLCLDAQSTTLAERTARLQHNRHLFGTNRIRRAAMKCSRVTVNRKKKLMPHTYRPGLELYESINRLSARSRSGGPSLVKLPRREEVKPIPAMSLESPSIAAPTQGVDIAEFKVYSPAREFREGVDVAGFPQYLENCQPQLVEEYVLETDMHSKEPDKRRVYQMKLSILQRPLNGEYLGELYLDRDHKKGERNGVASRFSLGTRVQAKQYIQQFTEIFTESGRKSVRVNYCFAQNQPQVQNPQTAALQAPGPVHVQPQPSMALSYQSLPVAGANTVVNGTTVNLVPAQQTTSASVPILQAQLQTNKQTQDANSEMAFNVLATKLMNSVQQIQAANAKQSTQKSTCSNAAIINLLNRSPASNINSDAHAAVVNAINNSQLLSQQQGAKFVGRKITVANMNMAANTRVLNAANVISVNNNRSLGDASGLQPQQITLSTVSGSNFFTTVTVSKQPQQQQARAHNDGGKAALSALLVGTAAADRPDIAPANTNSLLLEKLAGVSSSSSKNPTSPTFIQSPKQYAAQSPKMSPLSSPPPQTQTINVQGLNYTTIQGLQGVQVQLPGFSQPMRAFLNVSSTGSLQGQSLLVTVPVTTTANSAAGVGVTQCVNNNNSSVANAISVSAPTVVLGPNAGTSSLAQLVASGVNVKRAGAQGTVLTANSAPLQLVTPLQRPRQGQQLQQARVQFQQQVQRQTPITIKMATSGATVSGQSANVTQNVVQQVQKQFQHQQVQLQLTNQQQFHQAGTAQPQHIHLNKIARRSSQNVSDPP